MPRSLSVPRHGRSSHWRRQPVQACSLARVELGKKGFKAVKKGEPLYNIIIKYMFVSFYWSGFVY